MACHHTDPEVTPPANKKAHAKTRSYLCQDDSQDLANQVLVECNSINYLGAWLCHKCGLEINAMQLHEKISELLLLVVSITYVYITYVYITYMYVNSICQQHSEVIL